ncbi:polysaccharide biosynthesis/export family protein [Longitalea luteola]|uniref:polysaccharide biosynthesis/export family protein n=1 Tax=Longitalea luteola TaxID=2812563 RepID=UPI001A975BAD|nr:polysaccharide biosynthesis/export family protein [Longitalea luteola]
MLQLPVSRFIQACIFIVVVLFMGSCTSTKKAREELKYLDGNLNIPPNLEVPAKEIAIQKGDLLSIYVYSDNPEATAIFNQQVTKTGGGVPGYLVDQQGNIRFQTLGELHVEGLTKKQLMDTMDAKLKVYLTNPYTDIRFLNFHVNVLGEVNKPGPYSIPEEKLTILELIGLAGDLTLYGRRDNILVIREKEGKREFGYINLKDPKIFQSPYFNLQQNDVVMVQANKRKQTGTEQQLVRNLTILSAIASIVSVAALVYNVFRE